MSTRQRTAHDHLTLPRDPLSVWEQVYQDQHQATSSYFPWKLIGRGEARCVMQDEVDLDPDNRRACLAGLVQADADTA